MGNLLLEGQAEGGHMEMDIRKPSEKIKAEYTVRPDAGHATTDADVQIGHWPAIQLRHRERIPPSHGVTDASGHGEPRVRRFADAQGEPVSRTMSIA